MIRCSVHAGMSGQTTSWEMDQHSHLSITGENHNVQVGHRNLMVRSDFPVEVGQDSAENSDEEGESGWRAAREGGGQPGTPQPPADPDSAPDLEISGAHHSLQVGELCLKMPAGTDTSQLAPVSSLQFATGGEFSPKIKISGNNHDIQAGKNCIKITTPTKQEAPFFSAAAATTGDRLGTASLPATREAVEEEGGEEASSSSLAALDNVRLRHSPSSLQEDGGCEDTPLKATADDEISDPQQETPSGAQGKGENLAKWALLTPEERQAQGLHPGPIPVIPDTQQQQQQQQQRDIDLAVSSSRREPPREAESSGMAETAGQPGSDEEISNVFCLQSSVDLKRTHAASPARVSQDSAAPAGKRAQQDGAPHPRPGDPGSGGDDEICNDSLSFFHPSLEACSTALTGSQRSGGTTGSGTPTRTLTSSGRSQRSNGASSQADVDVGESRGDRDDDEEDDDDDDDDDEIANGSDTDLESTVKKADASTSWVASKTPGLAVKSQYGAQTVGKVDFGKHRESQSAERQTSSPEEITIAQKRSYFRAHSLDAQPKDGGAGGLAEYPSSEGFHSSPTAAAAAEELCSGFTDNEISNDAIYEIQVDPLPQRTTTPLTARTSSPPPGRKGKLQNTSPPGEAAPRLNASIFSSRQHVEIKEQSLEDIATSVHDWGPISDDEDTLLGDECVIQNPAISKFPEGSRHSPSMPFSIESDIQSFDILKSKSVLNSMPIRPGVDARLVERVTRLEQVLDDVKTMTSEGYSSLNSRLDTLEEMLRKILEKMTSQAPSAPAPPSGTAPVSQNGEAISGAAGEEAQSENEPASDSAESPSDSGKSTAPQKGRSAVQRRATVEYVPSSSPPTFVRDVKSGRTFLVNLRPSGEPLEPLRTMRTFKGDASVRPKERPSSSRDHASEQPEDSSPRGTKGGVTKGTGTGRKGVSTATRDAYGSVAATETRGYEGGTRGYDRGYEGGSRGYDRGYEGGTRGYDKGYEGGTRGFDRGYDRGYGGERKGTRGGRRGGGGEEDQDSEGDLKETRLRKPPRKETPRTLHSRLLEEQQEEEEAEETLAVPWKRSSPFSSDTLTYLERLLVVESRTQLETDPVARRLAAALEKAIHPGLKSMPPRALGMCTVLCLDNSASMAGRPLKQVLQFANTFLDGIEDVAEQHTKEENVAIVTIGGGAKVIHHFTNDYNSLRSALEGVRAEGRSPFFEALLVCFGITFVGHSLLHVGNTLMIKPRLIFITDGKLTDEARATGADTQTLNPTVMMEMVRLIISMQKAPVYPRPIVWVPVETADKTFMDAMSNLDGNMVMEISEIDHLIHNFRLQTITATVLGCILDMPEPPVNIMESIRSHIEVLQPNLSEQFKQTVFHGVFRQLRRHIAVLAQKKLASEKKSTGQSSSHQPPPTAVPRETHDSTCPLRKGVR